MIFLNFSNTKSSGKNSVRRGGFLWTFLWEHRHLDNVSLLKFLDRYKWKSKKFSKYLFMFKLPSKQRYQIVFSQRRWHARKLDSRTQHTCPPRRTHFLMNASLEFYTLRISKSLVGRRAVRAMSVYLIRDRARIPNPEA